MKTPYFENKNCVIYHGCLSQILPDLAPVDLVLCDPPYGMNFRSNHRTIKHDKIANDERFPIDLINLAMSKATCAAYFFCRWDNISQMPPPKKRTGVGEKQLEYGRFSTRTRETVGGMLFLCDA